MDVSRRGLLASAAGVALLPNLTLAMDRLKKRPKNIIFMVADGMADQVLSVTDTYLNFVEGKRSYWLSLLDRPDVYNSLEETRSLSSVVTDSAAASSAWGSGRRHWNGMLNTFPDKTECTPIGQVVKRHGMKVGLVTTTTITHATPAGFSVSVVQRDLEALIAEKQLAAGIDVLMGGGNRFFAADKRKDQVDLYARAASMGYRVCRTRDEMNAAGGGKLLGIFSESHLPYTIDRNHSPELQKNVPTLAEMTRKAIDQLKGGREGFLLQVEGGRVDHAGHGNDAAAIIHDQIAFEDAVKVAMEWAEADGDTLVIITSDHATGGPSLNGDGDEYGDTTSGLLLLGRAKSSAGALLPLLGDSAKLKEAAKEKLDVSLSSDELAFLAATAKNQSPTKWLRLLEGGSAALGMVLSNHNRVSWTSTNHTAECTFVSAFGPGASLVSHIRENVGFFPFLLGLKGIRFENPPQPTYPAARRAMESLKESAELEDLRAQYRDTEDGPEGAPL